MTEYAIYIAALLMCVIASFRFGHFVGDLDGYYHGMKKGREIEQVGRKAMEEAERKTKELMRE